MTSLLGHDDSHFTREYRFIDAVDFRYFCTRVSKEKFAGALQHAEYEYDKSPARSYRFSNL